MHQGAILCLPVIRQSSVIGVMYLENRLSSSAFTEAKTRMTELLVAQAAISIENSRLVREMKDAQEQIRKSLREKEVLLKEIHHRVKNNLQVIHSMLNLQLPYIKDKQALEVFKDCQTRIYSIALIHEKLYQSESLARVDLAAYFRSLTGNVFLSYGVDEREVKSEIVVEDIHLPINSLIPCALIVNELVSNAIKHAFPPDRPRQVPGKILVALQRGSGGSLVLTVKDNGVGLPEGFDIRRKASLGLRLVHVLARQLNGSLSISSTNGSEFRLEFESRDDGRS
mgnify:CR=1 FL=1